MGNALVRVREPDKLELASVRQTSFLVVNRYAMHFASTTRLITVSIGSVQNREECARIGAERVVSARAAQPIIRRHYKAHLRDITGSVTEAVGGVLLLARRGEGILITEEGYRPGISTSAGVHV